MKTIRLSWLLAGALVILTGVPHHAMAGPLYDPFLEEFQVGVHGDPDRVAMEGLWPAGLLQPAELDLDWLEAARLLFFGRDLPDSLLTHRFLAEIGTSPLGDLSSLREVFLQLENPGLDAARWKEWSAQHPYLRAEVWTRLFFHHLQAGRRDQARAFLMHGTESMFSLSARQQFVWQMRRQALEPEQAGKPSPGSFATPWQSDTRLGPFDRSQVWSLWVVHRRAAGRDVLPPTWQGKQDAVLLASLSKPYFTAAELEASSFAAEWKSGLGATLFLDEELASHLESYPEPPQDFTAQGWWVKGMRFLKRGQAAHYEELAQRKDLFPGWRMDVLRRASELRLIAGQWGQGLRNLRQALDIAAREEGTRGQRRLVRYWVEQALALAYDQGREDTAWQLLDWGDQTFQGEAHSVWKQETAHWRVLRTGERPSPGDISGQAQWTVAAGQAPPVVPGDQPSVEASRSRLRTLRTNDLWGLWVEWGQALADPAPLTGERRERAIRYADALENFEPDPVPAGSMPQAALAAVVLRLQAHPELMGPLLAKVIDRDICRLSRWQARPRPSPIPRLLPLLRRSQLDMHAALGVCLATGDMRGILAIAYELPGSGLTPEEKRRFLYPLPAEGPIRQAVLAAETEPALILAVARNESLFEPAVRSRAGALGWMQIMPFHFRDRGARPGPEHWALPAVSIGKGDQLLEENRRRYEGDPYLALAAYNAGPGAADRWLRQLGGQATSDVYLAWIGYTETRRYVEKVLIDREIYDWILTGQP